MNIDTWAVVVATLFGPILAVQAQKWLERRRSVRDRKEQVFSTLMATRNDRMSVDHVRALNMIDLVFDSRSSRDPEWPVHNAWKTYIDHLNENPLDKPESVQLQMYGIRDGHFYTLLERMSEALGYTFDRAVLKGHGYSPTGFGTVATELETVRHGLISILGGKSALKMEVTNLPSAPAPRH